jgi:CheY-like chemotaxis protein
MSPSSQPRILIVDDEEAILETMAFTFEDEYEVLTASDARAGLEILDRSAPVAAVITDQRMPEMTGVEFLARVCEHHPTTTRIILTGFAELDTIVRAINEGHAYAYVAKPWEPDELKQLVRRAVEHHRLLRENEQLMAALGRTNLFLETAMDEIPMGALAVDAEGVVRAANRAARQYLGLKEDPRGHALDALARGPLAGLREVARRSEADSYGLQEELDLAAGECCLRLRVGVRVLTDPAGNTLGRVVLVREISHEPLLWRFEQIVHEIVKGDGGSRERLAQAVDEFRQLQEQTGGPPVQSPDMAALEEQLAQAQTALENWLAVDEALAQDSYPDARMLVDRMRLAMSRWPRPDAVPERVRELARRVETYYDSGENPGKRIL